MKRSQEIKSFRKPREKHFLLEDGSVIAQIYDEEIHYLKNGVYEEIDNTLKKKNHYIVNKDNAFQTSFKEKSGNLLEMEMSGHKFSMDLEKTKQICPKIKGNEIVYEELLDGIDIKYQIFNHKIKESILLKEKNKIPDFLTFRMKTDLELVKNNNTIDILENGILIFQMVPPYMEDAEGRKTDAIYYELKKKENEYQLSLLFDHSWLQDAVFPVLIDPTITKKEDQNSVYDTYIFPNDNSINRNQDFIRMGVEKKDGKNVINRALLKFELPEIGTGSQIIKAEASLIGYVGESDRTKSTIFDVHRVTQDWNETTANWTTMNDKYDSRIEGYAELGESRMISSTEFQPYNNQFDITSLVKKWYSGMPNYGFMMKAHEEEYSVNHPAVSCFSKNNNVTGDNPKPILIIHYRNQNGLEPYMDYQTQTFQDIETNANLYNGNLVATMELGETISGKFPAHLSMIYNTNDVILKKDYGYGLGFQLNYHQLLEIETIDSKSLLRYQDGDGTYHYFYKGSDIVGTDSNFVERDPDTYYDEDGLSLMITKVNDNWVMKDSDSNTSLFQKQDNIWYLKEITDTNQNKIKIEYQDHKIVKIIDGNEAEIKIIYEPEKITIKSPDETVVLHYENNQITNIETKNGMTTIQYNNQKTIEKIIDTTGKKIQYMYYDTMPYRVKKISEYGILNGLGNQMDFEYGYHSTTVKDLKNHYTYTFNENGNTIGITSLKQTEDIKKGFGKQFRYGDKNPYTASFGTMNKLLNESGAIQVVKNYIENSSFEQDKILFDSSNNTSISIQNAVSTTGNRSLKIENEQENASAFYSCPVPTNSYYTLSAYIKTTVEAELKLSYMENNEEVSSTVKIKPNLAFQRYETTLFYPENVSDLMITLESKPNGSLFVDDIQLEEGELANLYNLIDDSDFERGIGDFEVIAYNLLGAPEEELKVDTDIVTLSGGNHALKIHSNPYLGQTIKKTFPISGKAGDVYSICFWYKNTGVEHTLGPSKRALIGFRYKEEVTDPSCLIPRGTFTANHTEWQFFEETFQAEYDYDSFYLMLFNDCNVNDLYLTNFALYKPVQMSTSYVYDDSGNMTNMSDPLSGPKELAYDQNNQLIQMMDVKGSNFVYEYDNEIPDRVLKGISKTGISNEIKYDSFGNPVVTRITNKNKQELTERCYYIRLKGTEKYLRLNDKTSLLEAKEDICSHEKFRVQKRGVGYSLELVRLPGYYLYQVNNRLTLSKYQYSLFDFLKNKNGSYKLKLESANEETLTATVNPQSELDPLKRYLTLKDNLVFEALNEGIQEFYLEETDSKLFIENEATYTEDGKFLKSVKDTLGRVTSYEIDSKTGLTKSITDPNNVKTNYFYNDKEQLTKVLKDNKFVEYEYNDLDLLSKIKHGNKVYNFVYDEFLNTKEIQIGSKSLITNNYENNNGNLMSSIYGNGGTIQYLYDDFDRIAKIRKEDNEYTYLYDNLGNIAKIKSNKENYRYYYDMTNRIMDVYKDAFSIHYEYDEMSNVKDRMYSLSDQTKHLGYEYNEDNSVKKFVFDQDGVINYQYDELGRLEEKCLNDIYKVKYQYKQNGYKTSFVVEKMEIGNDVYEYHYDALDNIIDIYYNGSLQNHYEYDFHNELVKEDDYQREVTTRYIYDTVGNIISKKEYEIGTEVVLKEDQYQYQNSDWEDQLTRFNDEEIVYDEIGNPVQIGDKSLVWINGRQLKSIGNVSFEYDKDSVRTKKKVGEKETKYYVENKNIIIEETEGIVIYYIRDEKGQLIGFKYQEENYYYKKNLQEDIVGILDSNYNEIVKYQYDAYGKITSIKDQNGLEITDQTHIAHINPFRYRSYYYDKETNLYYLNSRYYSPLFGRFINSDTVIAGGDRILLSNMYTYAENNPITKIDSNGRFGIIAVTSTIVGIAVGTISSINKMVDHHKNRGRIGLRDWVQYVSEGSQDTAAIMSFGMTAQSLYDTVSFTYNSHKASIAKPIQTPPKAIHGNSLKTTKPAGGYVLVSRSNPKTILKYGETTMGYDRYTHKYLDNLVPEGADMKFRASGTKYEMHYWQHNMIIEYTKVHGQRPPFNKNDW